jgi:hypothetical protein
LLDPFGVLTFSIGNESDDEVILMSSVVAAKSLLLLVDSRSAELWCCPSTDELRSGTKPCTGTRKARDATSATHRNFGGHDMMIFLLFEEHELDLILEIGNAAPVPAQRDSTAGDTSTIDLVWLRMHLWNVIS